jgi:hypothetical protein
VLRGKPARVNSIHQGVDGICLSRKHNRDVLTRDEHLAWCKKRALEYVDAGDLNRSVKYSAGLNKPLSGVRDIGDWKDCSDFLISATVVSAAFVSAA